MLRFCDGRSALLQPRNKRALEYTAITIYPVYYREAEYFFTLDMTMMLVTMVTASSKSNIFFLCCISVNVIWQIITMVLTSKQREKLRTAEMY